jgi:PAS domain S-box-containing protein
LRTYPETGGPPLPGGYEVPVEGMTITTRIVATLRRPAFWLIAVIMVLICIPYYAETIRHPFFITELMADLGLTRHAFERVLFMAPIVWAGFLFGWKGAFATSLAALALMLPRALFVSNSRTDAILETAAVFIISNVVAASFASLRREREYRVKLEVTHRELHASEERYRQLFENAHDAIWIHDLDGNFVTVNRAAEKLTGYSEEELGRMNVKSFLSEESLELAHRIRKALLENQAVEQPYEQNIIRRDGSRAFLQIATSLVFDEGKPVAFQHVARDVTEQKALNQNLRFFLQQATRAQEEERKRISHELHDDTIQALVALSRQLDALATSGKGLSDEARQRLEELWQQTDNIVQGVRRLSQDLRPAAIDRLGLLPALEWLASEVTKYSGVATKVEMVGTEHRLPEETAIALFRITQEALRNVWRHSGATSAEIIVEFEDKKARITINDNGKGFELPGKVGDLARSGKLGLTGMQERAQLVGGTLTVESQPGVGTTIIVEAPG